MTTPEAKRVYVPTMKIWHLTVADPTLGYDGAVEFTVYATTEQKAREVACDAGKPEYQGVWLDSRRSTAAVCGRANPGQRAGVLMSDRGAE